VKALGVFVTEKGKPLATLPPPRTIAQPFSILRRNDFATVARQLLMSRYQQPGDRRHLMRVNESFTAR
jgi:hypothetical protein